MPAVRKRMSMNNSTPIPEEAPQTVKVTAIELTERNTEKNRFSCIRLAFDAWLTRTGALTSRVTYTRRYDLDAEFDSVSNYFQISDTVVSGCRNFIEKYRLLEDFPAKKPGKKPGTYSEIKVFSGRKVVSRVFKKGPVSQDAPGGPVDEMFVELSRLLQRSLG